MSLGKYWSTTHSMTQFRWISLDRNRHFPSQHTSFPFSPFFYSSDYEKDFLRIYAKFKCLFPSISPSTASTWINIFPFHHLKSPAFSVIFNWPAWVFQNLFLSLALRSLNRTVRDRRGCVHTNSNWFDPSESEWNRHRDPTVGLICISFAWIPNSQMEEMEPLQLRMDLSQCWPKLNTFLRLILKGFYLPRAASDVESDEWDWTIKLKNFVQRGTFVKFSKLITFTNLISICGHMEKGSLVSPKAFRSLVAQLGIWIALSLENS